MKARIAVRCPSCATEFEILYIFLGAPVSCVACGTLFVAEVEPQTIFPYTTEFETGFGDFLSLAKGDLEEVFQFFADCLEFSPKMESGQVRYFGPKGELVDPLLVHLIIQCDPELQLRFYRLKMSLWRF